MPSPMGLSVPLCVFIQLTCILLWADVGLVSSDIVCPATCDCLTSPGTINCQSRTFTDIPTLSETTTAEILNLKYNQIHVLSPNAFSMYPNLVDINLDHNKINWIDERTFSGLPDLRRISVSYNNITTLPERLFEHCPTVTDVEFAANPYLTELPIQLFTPLPLLKLLKINEIGTRRLDVNIFSGNPILTTLLMEGVPLEELPARIFYRQSNLAELNLNAMNLHNLEEELFRNTISLSILELEMNPLSTFPAGVFANLVNLKELRLSRTQMHIIPEDLLFGLDALEVLWLNRLPAMHLPPYLLRDNTHLIELHLEDTLLETLPEELFLNNSLLETIKFDGCPITSLPSNVFKPLRNLKSLSLHKTQLRSLSVDLFQSNAMLESLSLNYSPLKVIPKQELSNLRLLKTLSLSQSYLTYIDEDSFQGLDNLQTITLTYNNITTIEPNTFTSQLNSGRHVYLSSNPITCDCFMRPFRIWLSNNPHSTLVQDMHILCKYPPDKAGRLLSNIPVEEMSCADPQSRILTTFVRVNEGQRVSLTCSIVGSTQPTVIWEIPEGLQIEEGASHQNGRNIRALNNHTLVVEQADKYLDSGEYACIVRNTNGRHISYASVEVAHDATIIPPAPDPTTVSVSGLIPGWTLVLAIIITMLLTVVVTLASVYAIYRHARFSVGNIDGDKNQIVTELR